MDPAAARVRAQEALTVRADFAPTAAILGVSLAASTLAVLIFALKASTPIWDDGAIILAERYPLTVESLLRPHHQHLNLVPIALWAVLPGAAAKLAALLLAHVALVTATTAFLVSRLGPVQGFALTLPLAVLGSSHYNLLVPWQILFPLALLAGLGIARLSLPRERPASRRLGVLLLSMLAVTTSNAGLFVMFAVGLWLLLERRWRQITELLPAAFFWLSWYVTIGLHYTMDDEVTLGLNAVPNAVTGLAAGLASWAGLPWEAGYALVALGIGWFVVRRPAIHPGLAAFVIAVLVMFFALSFFRAQVLHQSASVRYLYLGAFMLAFGIGLAAPRIPARWPVISLAMGAAALNVRALLVALPAYP